MKNPKRQKTCELNYKNPKLPALSIESLPNEIFINIFSNLNIKDLLKCGQVNKKFRQISHDKSFWKCVNLYNQNVSCELIGHILRCEIYDFCLLSFCQNERTQLCSVCILFEESVFIFQFLNDESHSYVLFDIRGRSKSMFTRFGFF